MCKSKKMYFIGSCLLFLGILGGCNKTEDLTSIDSSVQESTIFSSSYIPESEVSDTDESMNLTQIQQGDYSSLVGNWEEVAVSLNRHDGAGSVWMGPQGNTLSISQNQISTSNMTLQGNILNDGEDKSVVFAETEGYLTADTTSDTAILWNLFFYPKEVDSGDWGDDFPVTVDSEKDRIFIRTSNNNYLQVFQKNSEIDLLTTKTAMNFDEIKSGNYASMNGVWQNGEGQTITVNNPTMSFTDISGQGEEAEMSGLILSIPQLTDADGTPNQVPYMDDSNLVPAYQQDLSIHEENGVLSFRSGLPGAGLFISFLPTGVAGDIQGYNNTDQERIVAIGTQNNPTVVQGSKVYYRKQ